MKKSKQKGFTLLELLLVVGIAAILIVAGITTYNLVNKSNQINETTRLVNTILDQTRRLFGSSNNYGTADIEAALYNSGSVPPRYKAGAGVITTPFDQNALAVAVTGATQNFTIALRVPPAYAPELAQNFNPGTSSDIISLAVCGATTITQANAATAMSAATLSTSCGSTTTLPAAANFTITAR